MTAPGWRQRWSVLQWSASCAFTAVLFVSALVWAAVIVLCGWLPVRRLHAFARGWARFNLWLLRRLCGLDWVLEGREHIPATGAHVTMWKHSSSFETIAQMLIFPAQAWVLKRELYWIPLVGWAIWLLRCIGIDRGAGHRAVRQVLQQGRERLAAGLWVLIFPEGTRVASGESRRYGVSGVLLAAETGALLVPVAHDAGEFWARRGLLKRPGTIRVVIGPPLAARGRDPRAVNAELQQWIDGQTAAITGRASEQRPAL
ncbi:MAG: 1-acyl-sn-glycerol-3-phosphate acyltransferase [Gammaproteobacteria bacterium]|nr:1-acyl-sn-glycerol-3-phosphate acyltransferase [Gammaproteobacteria bacterium]